MNIDINKVKIIVTIPIENIEEVRNATDLRVEGNLEYTDEVTLSKALEGRVKL